MTHRPFPPDLVELHRAYARTYRALAGPRSDRTARLRRELVRLHTRVLHHPYWSTRSGSPSAGWASLRQQLRAEDGADERVR